MIANGKNVHYAALDFNISVKGLFAQNMHSKLSKIGQAPRFTSQQISLISYLKAIKHVCRNITV